MTLLNATDSFDLPSSLAALVAPHRAAPPSVNIAELKRKSVPELQEMAESQAIAIDDLDGMRKQDLIFRIEQKLLDQTDRAHR